MKIYERNLNSSVRKEGDQYIIVDSSLLDLNHSMRVELKIDMKSDTIVQAIAEITKVPLTVCEVPLKNIKKIEGFVVERGINRKLVTALGGSCGCTHLYELSLNAVRMAFNVKMGMQFDWEEWTSRVTDEEDFIEQARPHLKGSCYPFR